MVEIGKESTCIMIMLAGLQMAMLLNIEETSGILKEALGGVLISIEQFLCNMKALCNEQVMLKQIRGYEGFVLQEYYSEEDYIEEAGFLESGIVWTNTERKYFEIAVLNKFAIMATKISRS